MYRRLRRLKELKLIDKRPVVGGYDVISVYELTAAGLRLALKNKGCSHDGQLYSQAAIHDLNLADIVIALEGLNVCKRVWTETEISLEASGSQQKLLKAPIQHTSDAYCIFEGVPNDIHCAIEYERTMKATERSMERMHYYHEDSRVQWVLYIVDSATDMETLMKADRAKFRREDSKSHFCLRSDLLSKSDQKTKILRSDYSEITMH